MSEFWQTELVLSIRKNLSDRFIFSNDCVRRLREGDRRHGCRSRESGNLLPQLGPRFRGGDVGGDVLT